KLAAVNDDAANRGSVPSDELGRRVDDNIRAPLDGATQRRRRRGVVDNQRYAFFVSYLCQLLDIHDVEFGIAQGLGVDSLRLLVDGRAQAAEVVGIHKFHFDAELGQRVVKQVVSATVERSRRDDF